MNPANDLLIVRKLAADLQSCEFYQPVLEELRNRGLDSDDLLEILRSEVGETHCFKTEETRKHYPNTVSDYYSIWIDECGCNMFLKLLVATGVGGVERLIVTSFKRDDRYDKR